MTTLVLFILDAAILMVLMRLLSGAKCGFISSLIAAVLGAVAATLLTNVFTPVGPHAGVVAALLVAVGFGIGISLVFDVGLGSAVLIGFLFLLAKSGIYFLLAKLMTA